MHDAISLSGLIPAVCPKIMLAAQMDAHQSVPEFYFALSTSLHNTLREGINIVL